MNKLGKIWDVITERNIEKEKTIEELEEDISIEKYRKAIKIEHAEKFEELRDRIEREGIKTEKGFYNYNGAMYCTNYPWIIQTGGAGSVTGKFKIYGIEPDYIYVDLADVPDMADFINTYRR